LTTSGTDAAVALPCREVSVGRHMPLNNGAARDRTGKTHHKPSPSAHKEPAASREAAMFGGRSEASGGDSSLFWSAVRITLRRLVV